MRFDGNLAPVLLVSFIFLSFAQTNVAQTCPSDSTPTDVEGPFYVEGSPVTNVIGPPELLEDPANVLVVAGRILSSRDCSLGLSNVRLEIWYAGEDGYSDDEYRGQVMTNECGEYNFTQTFPALYAQRPIIHNHYKLSRDNRELLTTQMYFIGDDPGYVNAGSRELQAVATTMDAAGTRYADFDMFVDIDGDAACEDTADAVPSSIPSMLSSSITTAPTARPTSAPTLAPSSVTNVPNCPAIFSSICGILPAVCVILERLLNCVML